jgi:hypothetical protein
MSHFGHDILPNGDSEECAALSDKTTLTPLEPGFYVDEDGIVYFEIKEFLDANNLPDVPELRSMLLEELEAEFGEIIVRIIPC